jgi:hypothetical protein
MSFSSTTGTFFAASKAGFKLTTPARLVITLNRIDESRRGEPDTQRLLIDALLEQVARRLDDRRRLHRAVSDGRIEQVAEQVQSSHLDLPRADGDADDVSLGRVDLQRDARASATQRSRRALAEDALLEEHARVGADGVRSYARLLVQVAPAEPAGAPDRLEDAALSGNDRWNQRSLPRGAN